MKCPIELCGHDLKNGYDMCDHLEWYHTKLIIIRTLTKRLYENQKEDCHLWVDKK